MDTPFQMASGSIASAIQATSWLLLVLAVQLSIYVVHLLSRHGSGMLLLCQIYRDAARNTDIRWRVAPTACPWL
jgi:hypothetical protein